MIRTRLLFLPLIAIFLSACTASGPLFTKAKLTNPEHGLVYVYNPTSGLSAKLEAQPDLKVDSILVGKVSNGGYVVFEVSPGNRLFTIHEPIFGAIGFTIAKVEIEVEANKIYYARILSGTNLGGQSFVKEVSERRALRELPKMKKQKTSQIKY